MTDNSTWARRLFQSIDAKDTQAFLGFLHRDVIFRFGNAEPVRGRSAAGELVGGFFDSIHSLRHELSDTWCVETRVICHGRVTYTRHDGSRLCVPFATILHLESDQIREYLIYADISELHRRD